MPTTGARVAKVSRANLAAGGSLGPTGMLPSADRRGGWRAQRSTHLPGTSYGDTTSIHLSSPICPPTRKALAPEEVQELLGATGGAGGNHVPSSGGWRPPPSTDPCMPSTLGSRSLSGLSGSRVCAAPVRAGCGSPAWLV